MDSKKISRIALVATILGIPFCAWAQTPPTPDFSPPTVQMVDRVGVSITSGRPSFSIAPVAIGPQGDRFTFSETFNGGTYPDAARVAGFFGHVEGSHFGSPYGPGLMTVNVLGSAELMVSAGDGVNYVSKGKRGGSLSITSTASGWVYRYVDRNGAVYDFNTTYNPATCADHDVFLPNGAGFYEVRGTPQYCALLQHVTYPDGRTLDIGPQFNPPGDSTRLVQKVTRGDGWQFVLEYAYLGTWLNYTGVNASSHLTKVTAYNMATDYCDATAAACTFSRTWPVATYAWGAETANAGDKIALTVVDAAGETTRYTEQITAGVMGQMYRLLVGVKPPSSASADTVTYGYANQRFCFTFVPALSQYPLTDCQTYVRDGLVVSAANGSGNWAYAYTHSNPTAPIYSMQPGQYSTSVTRPDGFVSTAGYNALTGYVTGVSGTAGSFIYDNAWQTDPNVIQSSTDAEGRSFGYLYDGRGNLTSRQQYPGTSGPVMAATYPATCASAASCNKPTQIIDPNGKVTDYTYDPVHGGMLTETRPADVNGIRPQTRYGYVQRTPWLKNASGSYSPGAPIWKLANTSICRTGAAGASGGCSVAGDEVVTTYEYGPDAGPNNLLLRGTVVTADGISHRTCYAYNENGDRISQTTPGAGLASCP